MKSIPIPGTKHFSKYGKGIYEEVCEGFYHRIAPLDENYEFDFYSSMITSPRFVIPRSQTERNKRYTYRR